MVHGIDGFFRERARSSVRLSVLTAVLSAAAFGALLLAYTPPVREALNRTVRFGYEGPNQYVRRIQLMQAPGPVRSLSDVGQLRAVARSRGGADARPSVSKEGTPVPRLPFQGPGTSDINVAERVVTRMANVPVVQSEDLVFDRLVKPLYPEPLLEKNIEGKVTVQALIDTIGRVIDVQVLTSTGEPLFENAAETAVWQCRFRPFSQRGLTREVYALFHFEFTVY